MTARIAVALLFVIPAALAYPWESTAHRWLLGAAVVVVIVAFAWWRGLFLTTMVARRLAICRRNHRKPHAAGPSVPYVTVLMRVEASGPADLPLPLIAGYVDRYGLRAHKVRVTSRTADGLRTTWIGLTVGATDNLAALRARSARLPLRETAEVAARRLTDHLRERGWDVTIIDNAESPVPASAKETWRGLRDESGYVAAYRVHVDDRLAESLAAIESHSADEVWTALEVTGSATRPAITVGCALRTEQRPAATAPLPGLTPQRGRQRPALESLDPLAVNRIEGAPVALPAGLLEELRWPVADEKQSESLQSR